MATEVLSVEVVLSDESELLAVAVASVVVSSGAAQELTPSARIPIRARMKREYRKRLEVAIKTSRILGLHPSLLTQTELFIYEN